MVREGVRAETGYIWAVLGTGNTAIISETSGTFGGGLGHGSGECSDYKTSAEKRWEGMKRLAAHQHGLPCCSSLGLWACWLSSVECQLDCLVSTVSTTIDHVKVNKSSIPLLIFTIGHNSSHNLSADAGAGSTDSLLNTDAMPRPTDTIVPHSMSEHDRRLFFLSLEAGM